MAASAIYWPHYCFRGNIPGQGWTLIYSYSKVTFLILLMFKTNSCGPVSTNHKNISLIHDERRLENIASGEYSYRIQFSDGTQLEQKGSLSPTIAVLSEINVQAEMGDDKIRNGRTDTEVTGGTPKGLQVSGSYAFIDPASGIKHEVRYIADKSGYHPHYIATFASGRHKISDEHEVHNIEGGRNEQVENAENDDSTPLPPLETISASLFSSQSEKF